jgi:hypothetical protein
VVVGRRRMGSGVNGRCEWEGVLELRRRRHENMRLGQSYLVLE